MSGFSLEDDEGDYLFLSQEDTGVNVLENNGEIKGASGGLEFDFGLDLGIENKEVPQYSDISDDEGVFQEGNIR